MLPDSHLTCALVCSSLFRVSLMGARTRPTGPCRPGSSRPTGKKHLRGSSSRPSGKMHLRGSPNLRCYSFRTRPTGPCRPGSSRPTGKMHLRVAGSPPLRGYSFLLQDVYARRARVHPQSSRESVCAVTFPHRHQSSTGD